MAEKQYGIFRVAKVRNDSGGLEKENNRTKKAHEEGLELPDSNPDWERTYQNVFLIKTDGWKDEADRQISELEETVGRKVRKDAVRQIQAFFSASPEFFEDKFNYDGKDPSTATLTPEGLKYFNDCLDFYVNTFCSGDRSRVINAVIHLDEKTPHMHIEAVPITLQEKQRKDLNGQPFVSIEPTLSAKRILNGRTALHLLQTKFHEDVTAKYGLLRGEVREANEVKAHTTKREWEIAKQQAQLDKNQEILDRQVEKYNTTVTALAETTSALRQTAQELDNKNEEINKVDKELNNKKNQAEILSEELLDKLKVNTFSDRWNKDTVTVNKKVYEALTEAVKGIDSQVQIIKEAEDISSKKVELTRIKAEKLKLERERDELEQRNSLLNNEYERMSSFISEHQDGLKATMERIKIEKENTELKKENKQLTSIIKKIDNFLDETDGIPSFIRTGLKKIINKRQEKENFLSEATFDDERSL